MKHRLLYYSVLASLIFNSCTKETTIKESYNPPKPGLFGTWKQVNSSSDTIYYEFPDDNSNYFYTLYAYRLGYHTSSASAYIVSDKQVMIYGTTFNYEIKNDTMWMYNSPGNYTKYLKVNNVKITHQNWVKSVGKVKSIDIPQGYSYSPHPFGINGDIIYPYGKVASLEYIYQYNTLTGQFEDSVQVSEPASTCFNSGNVYAAFDNGSYMIFKTDMNSIASNSTNTVPYPRCISINKNTGEIFVYDNSLKLYKGSDGGSYSVAVDMSPYSCDYVQYYKDGEFLCLYGGTLHKVLPGLSFKVTASYDMIPGFNIYQFSTNGDSVWLYGYDSQAGNFKLVKVSLN